jgi:hypothetical protein
VAAGSSFDTRNEAAACANAARRYSAKASAIDPGALRQRLEQGDRLVASDYPSLIEIAKRTRIAGRAPGGVARDDGDVVELADAFQA